MNAVGRCLLVPRYIANIANIKVSVSNVVLCRQHCLHRPDFRPLNCEGVAQLILSGPAVHLKGIRVAAALFQQELL